MVKGVSKQVIVLNSHDRALFDQAIFILSDDAIKNDGVTDDVLMKEAKKLIGSTKDQKQKNKYMQIVYTLTGAVATGIIWLLTVIM